VVASYVISKKCPKNPTVSGPKRGVFWAWANRPNLGVQELGTRDGIPRQGSKHLEGPIILEEDEIPGVRS